MAESAGPADEACRKEGFLRLHAMTAEQVPIIGMLRPRYRRRPAPNPRLQHLGNRPPGAVGRVERNRQVVNPQLRLIRKA